MHVDLLIIGGSAAASAGAVYAARREVNVTIIAQDWGGEVASSGQIGNYPGFIETNGIELADTFRKQVEANNIPIELGVKVTQIVKNGEGDFQIKAKKDGGDVEYSAKAVLVTTGVHPRELNADGEKNLRQKGVTYCTTCDGPLYRGKTVATIGGGNSALESALMLKEICPKVYLLTINSELMGETIYITKLKQAQNVEIIYNASTKKFIGTDRLEAIEYDDAKTKKVTKIEVQGAFVHIGLVPNSAFLPKEIKKNKLGEVVVNKVGETSVSGIFSAGDVTDTPFKQIAIATGQGVSAVLRAIQYLDSLS
ncbi:hypothetical protein AUK41_00875 [Candidatus Berkelbacteria bacterium CG2_30_43_20]|nr:MAG: hypothetical protein AUK41_00875 [Candidatus Berkelbacteria bacterium CG2_30_43_20]